MTRESKQQAIINYYDLTATIANGQTVSGAVDIYGNVLCGFFVPAAFTGTAITLQTSDTLAGTYVPVYDKDGNQVSFTVAVSEYIYVDPIITAATRYIKLVSGSAEGAERVIKLALRPV